MTQRTIITLAGALATLALTAPTAAQGFGQTVHVANDELFVGESLYTSREGRVYVYRKDANGSWTETAQLKASDAAPNDHFGRTILLAEGDLLVGATVARESGALYVFERTADGWRERTSLVPNDAHPDHSFGRTGVTDGRIVLVSDWAADESRGAVYVFEKRDGAWRETAKLTASDAAQNDYFGYAIAIGDDRVVISARNKNQGRGAVYTFRRSGDLWQEVDQFAMQDATPNMGLGSAVALIGDRLVVSAPGADQFIGAFYTYRPADTGDGWTLVGKTSAPGGTPQSNSFGFSLARVGGELWAGAPGVNGGRIFRYTSTADEWQMQGELNASGTRQNNGLGGALDATNNVAVAGAISDDFQFGSVVVFEPNGAQWGQASLLKSEVETLDPIVGNTIDCADGKVSIFGCQDVNVLSFLPVDQIGGGRGVEVNDVWGWTDPQTGKEWAIVGRYDGTSFIDVSNPTQPVFVADLPLHDGAQPNSWRDIKVYRDHAFIVADGAGPHGVQVVDLTRLRNVDGSAVPVKLTEDAHYDRVASAHNIVINEETGFAYAVGVNSGGETCGGGLHMIDIREPKTPRFAGCFQDMETGNQRTGYTHDAQCVIYNGPDTEYRGREICLGANETALSIADVTDKASPIAISRAAYPNVGYTHQGWLDEQHEYFYINDEGDELSGTVEQTRTLVWDVRDLDDPVLVKEHFGTSKSSDHNLYVRGNLMYQSNYVSGLRIIDITNRAEPREIGFFDTVPWSDDPGFDGSWSNYPFFASGTIVVTSGKEGVFFLKQRIRPVS